MKLLRRKISVKPNEIGFLYRKNRLEQRLEAGVYSFFDPFSYLELVALPTTNRFLQVANQEVLTKDNIAFRFSYFVEYKISDGEKFLANFNVFQNPYNVWYEAEQLIHNLTQVVLREQITKILSEEINDKRAEILNDVPENLQHELKGRGIEILRLTLRDVTFPKAIQDLFAKQLEAKIRGKADLENARTAVATARTLKNVSELMKDDENIKFVQILETITKIAEKGKHTFIIGDVSQNAILKK